MKFFSISDRIVGSAFSFIVNEAEECLINKCITPTFILYQLKKHFDHGCDASNPSDKSQLWLDKKGHDKAIEITGSRARLNLVGAIDLNNLAGAQVKRYEKVNSETIQAFFTELRVENGSNKRIHLILDGAGLVLSLNGCSKSTDLCCCIGR